MKYLIVFKSKHGTTKKLVHEMYQYLGIEKTRVVELGVDLIPDLNQFNTILIGGSIHGGSIQKEIRSFCQKNSPILLKKKLGLFLCFMMKEKGQAEFEKAFPAELRQHAVASGLFGGELVLEKMNFFERFITRIVAGKKRSISQIDYNAVREFEHTVKND